MSAPATTRAAMHARVRPDVDPAAEAALFLGMLRGASDQWLLDPRHVDIDALYDRIEATVARNLERR